jgi:UDP-N-acetylglucosamine--N-acetylmuramyl-(pentapeptide) pyrophosphoryl-undecaprenol N-acetylglucosamine transferase
MRILFVGGGTGGHFYPLIATAEVIVERAPSTELFYIGPEPYNQTILDENNIRFVYCPAGKVRRYMSILNVLDVFKTVAGIFVALWKLYWLYPDVIFSKGSYSSVPVLLAARWYRIPVVIHESDSKPGRANILAKAFARYIGIAYADVAPLFPKDKTVLVGIPLRKNVRTIVENPFAAIGIPNDIPLIYVTGGSLGSEKINNMILKSLTALLPHYRIFHQTGESHVTTVTQTAQALVTDTALLERYYVQGTLPATVVSSLLQAASLIISRAGSTTLFEIALHSKPAIIIPIPEEISHDQRSNAYSYAQYGGATVIEEGNLTPHLLTAEIQSIMGDPARYTQMQEAAKAIAAPDAASTMADILIAICDEHR